MSALATLKVKTGYEKLLYILSVIILTLFDSFIQFSGHMIITTISYI